MKTVRAGQLALAAAMVVSILSAGAFAEIPNTLKIYIMCGQSNMEGQAYAYDNVNTANLNVPTLEFLVSGTSAANNYLSNMPAATFTFKDSLDSSWLTARNDVWGVHYNSGTGTLRNILPTNDPADIVTGIQPMQPGFGASTSTGSMFGVELSMGVCLGNAMQTPVLLFKSDHGGTTLGNDWRPPSAVAARGGVVGLEYTNTVNNLKALLNSFDADLADDGKLNAYNNATGYEVCGLVWIQGWNEMYNDGGYTATQLQAEYAANLVDFVHDIRNCDPRVASDLAAIIPESTDQNATLNAARISAVAALNAQTPGSALYFNTDNMIGTNWGNNEDGQPFSTSWGYHYNARAENYLEIGWRIGTAIVDNGWTGTDPAPEPGTLGLLAVAGLAILRRRRQA